MADETVDVIVEAVGMTTWTHRREDSDPRWTVKPQPIALVRSSEGRHYVITGAICFRNGTTINPSIVGLKGACELRMCSPVSFNCPTMFGKNGL